MRKRSVLIVIAVIIGVAAWFFLQRTEPTVPAVKPELLNIGDSQVTISWLSREFYKGRVFYQPAGTDALPSSAAESLGISDRHEVTISGLAPSTRCTYWIANTQSRFQFQTQPLPNTPFSFVVVWGDISGRIVSLMMSEAPEFIISLTPVPAEGSDLFSDVRPYVPIYNLSGLDSVFLRVVQSKRTDDVSLSWKLDWGGLSLIFAHSAEDLQSFFDTPAAHTFGVITTAEVVTTFAGGKAPDKESLRRTALHSTLMAHNQKVPTRAAAFVAVVGQTGPAVEVDGITYLGIAAETRTAVSPSGAVRIDVDVESVNASFIDEQRQVVLKSPPLMQRRTCEQCRRLADKGAYEDSVRAYREFIDNNRGHYQIDDAYFAIAEILDEKLFRFGEALTWYNRLVAEYPDGTLTPLANQRIKYLSEYSDHDYKPLERFERIRKVEFARKKDNPAERAKLLDAVGSIIEEYPTSKLAPTMQYWLANQYRLDDPDKAVDVYNKLKNKYPSHPHAQEVPIEIAETYYEAERYKQALQTYKKALAELPALANTINAQITRCKRNIRRKHLAAGCWLIYALAIAVVILKKPCAVDSSKLAYSFAAFAAMAALLLLLAWLIREQFASLREMLLIVTSFSAATGVGSLLSTAVAEKLIVTNSQSAGKVVSALAGGLIGVTLFVAGIYLATYYINIHYLIVIGI